MRLLAALPLLLVMTQAGAVEPPAAIQGNWTVDLSANPDEPYTKPMVLQLQADGTVKGSFYESEILSGRWKTDRARTCVSFRTTDGAGPWRSHRGPDLGGAPQFPFQLECEALTLIGCRPRP